MKALPLKKQASENYVSADIVATNKNEVHQQPKALVAGGHMPTNDDIMSPQIVTRKREKAYLSIPQNAAANMPVPSPNKKVFPVHSSQASSQWLPSGVTSSKASRQHNLSNYPFKEKKKPKRFFHRLPSSLAF